MIYLVHGENLSTSRKLIINQQKKLNLDTKTELDITETTPNQLLSVCSTFDMWGTAPFIVLDISAAGRMKLDKYTEIIQGIPKETVLIILSSKKLSKSNIFLKNATKLGIRIIENSETNAPNIFKFVDLVFNKNRKGSYQELRKLVIASQEPFYIFSMLLYGLRNIAYAKFGGTGKTKMSPFVKGKAIKQAEKFSEEEILKLIEQFYKMDKGAKTGELDQEILVPLTVEKILHAQV
jgi:DNA polymerase III delta subunit